MLLDHGEELPPPSFLGESTEHDYLTQVQQHVAMVKTAATSLLGELAKEITDVETQRRSEGKDADHPWMATSKAVADFSSASFNAQAQEGEEAQENHFLDVSAHERLDVVFHDPSGWSWCIAEDNRGQGYVPSNLLIEIASVLESHSGDGNSTSVLPVSKRDEVEVLLRHYSGWSLCRKPQAASQDAAPSEGWVPDSVLSDHPRSFATKQHRLILNGLHRLAEDAYGVEASFYKLRTQGAEEAPATLESLYGQVLTLIEEYKTICQFVQAKAQAGEAEQASVEKKRATKDDAASPQKKGTAVPDWVYVGSRCLWNSKSQGHQMPVTIRKVCLHREQVLVVFDETPTARKIIDFKAFADLVTCPLWPRSAKDRTARSNRSRRKGKGAAQQAVERAEEALADDLRGMMDELGSNVEDLVSSRRSERASSRRGSAHSSISSEDSDDSSDVSSSDGASTVAPPPETSLSEMASAPSAQHSARLNDGGGSSAGAAQATEMPSDENEAMSDDEEAQMAGDEAPLVDQEETSVQKSQPTSDLLNDLTDDPESEVNEDAAATQLQSAFRGRCGRRKWVAQLSVALCQQYLEDAQAEIEATARLQMQREDSASRIQSRYRGNRDRAKVMEALEAAAAAEAAEAAEAAARAEAAAAAEAAAVASCKPMRVAGALGDM
jgi:hypothetical protein